MPNFTDRYLKGLKLEEGQKDRLLFDTDCRALGVRLTAKGTRAFLVQWTDPATKKKVRERLGDWGSLTIDQARTAARVRIGEVAKGLDPAAERQRRKEAADTAKAEATLSLDVLIDQWASLHLKSRRSRYAQEAVRAIRYAFANHLKRPARQLSRDTVTTILDKMAAAGNDTMAGRTMAYGRACYSWAKKRGTVIENPFQGLPVSATTSERERVLEAGEVREVWAAAGKMDQPFGPFYRFALLTLQRREEVAGARWSEMSDDMTMWSIPGERMKNGKPHDIRLTEAAREILLGLVRFADCDFVFTSKGKTSVSGFSKAKSRLDATIAAARERSAAGKKPELLEPWRMHDFRRTGVTVLAELGFDPIVVDKLLAHKPAKLKGVTGVYQRFEFMEERKRALEAWADLVTSKPQTSNVVEIRHASAPASVKD